MSWSRLGRYQMYGCHIVSMLLLKMNARSQNDPIEKIKAAAQKVKQGRVKVYSKEEKKLFDSLKQVCANVVIDKANCVRKRANEIDEQNYIKQMSE